MTEKKQVLHSDGTLEPLKPRLIKNKLLSIGLPEQEAEKIKTRVAKKLLAITIT